jgi:methylmalonyl-CoA/ethylmalonyl-CoA epimerase
MDLTTIRRIDHISIAVRSLEKAKAFFIGVLGGRELFSAPVSPQKFRWTTIELGTSCFIELIDPLETDGFVHRFLESRGEGPHHITIQVNDIQKVHQVMKDRGVPTFGLAEPFPAWKEFYVHPKHAFGTLIQFAEFNPLDWVEPGYIPPSYKEFAPAEKIDLGKSRMEVRRSETESGVQIEIRSGEGTLRIPEDRLQELITALSKV